MNSLQRKLFKLQDLKYRNFHSKLMPGIDKGNGTDYMKTIEQQAKLTEKHEMIIKQQTTPAKDLVES